ncbi:dynamin GTPase [Pochonia chlamydosporia 170]|uniref:Dynamin GTPase n=1 Tax=Pochonia chlamydosporia 170 TaxID=1380566 RepID=A0A179G2G4_METCM|nr:dynamin GTPase [Pochonia chlamydosporia 170]OAQ72044.1 dynamin GTPase [Pochonia chlamydosporia 170]
MFHFFRTEAATHLAGVFDQEFCTMGLLQASNLHPAVWYACTALAAMYQRESIASNTAAEAEQQRFYVMALKQYDASIKSIVDLIGSSESDTKHEILLTSCLLFTAICCLQGCLTTALVHLRNGHRLYHQWKSEAQRKESQDHRPSSSLINAKALIALLSRLCTQAIDLRDSHWEEWDIGGPDLVEPSPEPFTSPADAYLEFEPICNAFMEVRHRRKSALEYGQVGPAEELRHAYQKVLAAWTTKFYHLKASRAFSSNEFEGMLILEARYLSFYIELNRDPGSEMHWDTFQPQFARIVSLAENVFQISGQTGPSNQQMPRTLATRAFSFSSSVMDSIFSVTRYCRHYATRHRALCLLQNCSVKDGICDTKLASGLAAGLMGVEERPGQMNCLLDGQPDCTCDGFYICGEHRITVLVGELVEDGKVALMAQTARDVRLGLPGTCVPVSW